MSNVKHKSKPRRVNQKRHQIQKKKRSIPRLKIYIKDEHESNYYIEESNNKEVEALLQRLNASKAKSKKIVNDYKRELELESRNTALVTRSNKNSLAKTKRKVNVKKKFANTAIKIAVTAAMLYIVFGVFFGLKRMETIYMSPSIAEGDLLLYYRLDKNYKVGDIIYFNIDDKNHVLRIVAKEGQTVSINEEGKLLVDGYPETHEALYDTKEPENSNISYPYTVEEGKFFVVGDYRRVANDSRVFGAISEDEIKGKVMGRLQIRNF